MSRFRTLLEWLVILIPLLIIGFLIFNVFSGNGMPAAEPSGLPGNGGFFQVPLPSQQQYTKTNGEWQFTLTSNYAYTFAGKVVGRHEYPVTMPDGIIPLDLAVVNGDLVSEDILQYFTFSMEAHTLGYSYDLPTSYGLTEEYIDEHISNNHLVFLNATLEREVKRALVGNCLIIKGKLVDVTGSSPDSRYTIDTSTVRNDAYPAGCEIILVQSYMPVSCGN
ncbi:MAG: hypothetical protein Q7T80_08930 [Methanoregula sp.]|nr:hypothetical protein [Methanoregula sp.]